MQTLQLNTKNIACVLGIKYAVYGLLKKTKWYDPLLNGNQFNCFATVDGRTHTTIIVQTCRLFAI